MQLLQITTTPMKYELVIEPARLEYQQDFMPRAKVETTDSELKIRTSPTVLRLDTYEARRSLGFATAGDRIRQAAQKGRSSIREYTTEAKEMGKEMSNIHEDVTIAQIIRQKMLEQPEMYTAFLPSAGAEISWEPGSISLNYRPQQTDYDWQIKDNPLVYIPGSIRVKIVEFAKVNIEYLGSPMYIPPSADPNYEEPMVG
mgnify:FL=1